MSVSLYGVIDFVEPGQDDDAAPAVEAFCSFPSLGTDSLLARLLREAGEPLPKRLSWATICDLTIGVPDGASPTYPARRTATPAQARQWVEQGSSIWLREDDQSLLESKEPTDLVSDPDSFRGARSYGVEALKAVQAQYRAEEADQTEVVAVAPGQPLPERVVGYEGTDSQGRARLCVSREEGDPSPLLGRVIRCMELARAGGLEPRFICMFS